MDWFIAALIGAFSMALAWTFLKRAQEKGLPNAYALVIYYLILVVSLSSWQLVNKVSFPIPSFVMIIFILLVGCIPIISNLLVLHSFEKSANPGLTLSLVATSSLWLFLGGLFFYSSKFSLLAITGIILIFSGVAYINYQHQKADFRWILYGLVAGVLNALFWILVKEISLLLPDYSPITLLIYFIIPTIPLYLAIGKFQKQVFFSSLSNFSILPIIVFSALAGTVANAMNFIAVTIAPNPGSAQAIFSSNALITLLMSPFLSNSVLKLKHFISAVLIVAGVIMIKLVG